MASGVPDEGPEVDQMEYKDYYKILGLPRTASQAEIKKAFRKLAQKHHPDRNPGDRTAEQRFKDVNEAHAVLSDPDKRTAYDELGANWEAYSRAGAAAGASGAGGASPFGGFGGFSGQRGNVRYEFRTSPGAEGFSDFFRMFFGGDAMGGPGGSASAGGAKGGSTGRARGGQSFADILAGLGLDDTAQPGNGQPSRQRSAAPPAAEAEAELTLEEAYNGTTRLVQVDGRRLEVTIPRGVDTGSRVKLSGRGPDGRDLVVVIRVRPHPVFNRTGADLEREVPITLRDALLGGAVPVATLKGRVLLTIPPETQNGRVFRLAGQGMPRFKGDGFGDLRVRVRVVLPANLSSEAKDAARAFLDLVNQPDPRAN